MREYIKRFISDDRSYFALILIVVSVGSFGLGRLSLESTSDVPPPRSSSTQSAAVVAPLSKVQTEVATNDSSLIPTSTSVFDTTPLQLVASRNGTKYHRLDCPGAKQITEQNKITFDSIATARAAGYTPAANCKGLE